MNKILIALGLILLSPEVLASKCAEQIKVRGIYLTEERIEVETRKEGVTFGKIMDCLIANRENLGDMKFNKPDKKEAAVSFGIGQKITISKGAYEPFYWTAAYQHHSENLSGDDDLDLSIISHHLTLSRKNPLRRSLFLDVTGGLIFTRAHLAEPDTQYDAANDVAPTIGLRLWYQLPRNHEIYLGTHTDRFYTFDTDGDKFVYRAHLKIGWEGQVSRGFSLGANGGLNTLLDDGVPAEEFGGMMKFTYYNVSFAYQLLYERIETENTDVQGFRHTLSFLAQF